MQLKEIILSAQGQITPELVLKNVQLVNVFSGEIYRTDIAIHNGYIVGLGTYSGQKEVDLSDCYVCPGLIDGHIHLESSMVTPGEFARAVLPHGTTSVVADPHEIANVCGIDGINYIIDCAENIPLNIFLMAPSCVPATSWDENGTELDANMVAALLERPEILGLGEMMNFPGVLGCDEQVLAKLTAARNQGKIVDGHGPGLSGKALCGYIGGGISSDHESTDIDEALEKLRLGQWIMIREGTASKNMLDLLPLIVSGKTERCMLVTDDKHPGDLMEEGHLDFMIRSLIFRGVNPIQAVQMATLNPARYFGLKELGAVAPGYRGDLVVLSDLNRFMIKDVYKDGKLVVKDGASLPFPGGDIYSEKINKSFHMPELKISDLAISGLGTKMRVIGLVPGQIVTKELFFDVPIKNNCNNDNNSNGNYDSDTEKDLLKLIVVERHKNTGHIGKAFLHGYGLKKGAVASSVSHDSHNLVVVGADDQSMCLAANAVREYQGGLAIADKEKVLAVLPLPIAGLMSSDKVENVDCQIRQMKKLALQLGVANDIDPFMTLAFLALPVIPELKLTTKGLVKVSAQKLVPVVF